MRSPAQAWDRSASASRRSTSNKAAIRYAESVKFELTTESDTMPLGGWFSPLGLGLGYGSVGIDGGLGLSGSQLGLPSFY